MSKKQLLTEGEIRRFMKYANLGPLSENFLSEVGMQDEGMYEEEDMGGMADMPAEEPAPAPSGDLSVDEGDLAQMIKDAVKAALAEAGVGGEAAPEGEEMDVDMGDEEEMEGGEEEELEEMYHSHKEGMHPMDEDRMVSEVARRVMARLSESRKPQARPARAPARRSRAAAINEVTDRIMKRILKGK
jgi:hypothetical protein